MYLLLLLSPKLVKAKQIEIMVVMEVYGHKYSTVVPGTVTGENVVHEFTNTDLVMKLHYLKTVYYFEHSDVVAGFTIIKLKEPMFNPLLNDYFPAAGRIRRKTDSGRPVIKCNDSGVRIVEAKCRRTLEEWLELRDSSGWRHLVPVKVLGPDLQFSPTVYMQFTKFKCGGMAIGLSWSHILGDAMSATNFMNMWGQLLKGSKLPPKSIQPRDSQSQNGGGIDSSRPLSVKHVEPVGDCWLLPANAKMLTYCLQVTEANLKLLQQAEQITTFEIISAVIWQGLAKVRTDGEPKLVTICRYNPSAKSKLLSNEQKISIVTSSISPTNFGVPELAMMISKQDVDESKSVEELTYKDNDQRDFAFYGTNPTFVDMQRLDLHGLELKGQQPIKVDHVVDGVSKEGTVLVFKDTQGADVSGTNTVIPVMLILPEDEIMPLRELLRSQFGIA